MQAFIEKKNDKIIFTGNYMEVYIPEYYFEKGLVVENGDKLEIFGIFNFKVFNDIKSDRKTGKLHTFKFPSSFTTKPNSIEKEEMELVANSSIKRYSVLKYFKGDTLMTSINVVRSIDNVENFISLLNDGKLPDTLDYDIILDLILKNLEINGTNLDVSAVVLEAMITEIYRSKKDRSIPFRKVIGKGKAPQTDYSTANMRDIAQLGSTFTAITFEDPDSMIAASINRTRYGKREAYSPVEKLINY